MHPSRIAARRRMRSPRIAAHRRASPDAVAACVAGCSPCVAGCGRRVRRGVLAARSR